MHGPILLRSFFFWENILLIAFFYCVNYNIIDYWRMLGKTKWYIIVWLKSEEEIRSMWRCWCLTSSYDHKKVSLCSCVYVIHIVYRLHVRPFLRASTLVNFLLGFIRFFYYFFGGTINNCEPLSIVFLHWWTCRRGS